MYNIFIPFVGSFINLPIIDTGMGERHPARILLMMVSGKLWIPKILNIRVHRISVLIWTPVRGLDLSTFYTHQ